MQTRKRIVIVLVGALAVVLMAVPALAGRAVVTGGNFNTLSGGAGTYDGITGKALMVRTASGKTIVKVNVSGLIPGATYGSHVHNQACADGGGSHYSFGNAVPGGAADNGSEIWPGPFTANAAGNASTRTTVGATAGAAAVSVVIHSPAGTKIACADLS